MSKLRSFCLLLIAVVGLTGVVSLAWAQKHADAEPAPVVRVRIITDAFVLSGRLNRLAELAAEKRIVLDHVYVESTAGNPSDWLADVDLVVLDTPRPMDVAKVEERVGAALSASKVPWIRVGGGSPAFGNLPPEQARRLIGYYANGGEHNARAMFAFVDAWRAGHPTTAGSSAPPPVPLPPAGFYHPDAPHAFSQFGDYLAWGGNRWPTAAPRVAVIIHPGLISGFETQTVDALVAASEAKGLLPIVLWFDASDPQALQTLTDAADVDAIVIATHLQNGPARAVEFARIGVPVLQAISYREGGAARWAASASGMTQGLVAPFLALPETWGVSDPMVVDAVENGVPAPMPQQVEALVGKVAKLAALRRKPANQKQLALMFWNYPPGEKNLSASGLNVPRSMAALAQALASAGYDVPATAERDLIAAGQKMLHAVYHPRDLDALLKAGLAATVPVARYCAWLNTLSIDRRDELAARWGDPASDQNVRDVAGEKRFVIPRLQVGKLAIMPQLPRSDRPGAGYHDTKEVPSHAYLAAYLYVREILNADALIHLGTHGTQEWTPGKDRGLSASDYPYLAAGDLPIVYPYIQDNVAEALQAKRRGRAVIISHQTPPFAPAGLYDELRDLNAKIAEYSLLEQGAVRDRVAAEIRSAVLTANLHHDVGWNEARMSGDFAAFLAELHDHLNMLGHQAMPLGLHTLGVPAAPDHRLSTVMQQLGEDFYRRAGAPADTTFAGDYAALQASAPYVLLRRHLREGVPVSHIADPALRADVKRAVQLDRRLAATGEMEAMLAALSGHFVMPGPGGDPIRNPDAASGRNMFAFETDKVPTRAAYEAGGEALQQLLETYRAEHDGSAPKKLAFSLWASETLRHMGVVEAQVLHALGLRPVWNDAGRVIALEVIPREELGRPRIDAVLQVTSVYRDQLDGFMRLLAGAIDKLAALDEPDNPIAINTASVARQLMQGGKSADDARRMASLRIFSNAPGDYGTDLPRWTLSSTEWNNDTPLAEAFLSRLQFAYGAQSWGQRVDGDNLFARQLSGAQAAVLSRSSNLHGILSTDHPFEYLCIGPARKDITHNIGIAFSG